MCPESNSVRKATQTGTCTTQKVKCGAGCLTNTLSGHAFTAVRIKEKGGRLVKGGAYLEKMAIKGGSGGHERVAGLSEGVIGVEAGAAGGAQLHPPPPQQQPHQQQAEQHYETG